MTLVHRDYDRALAFVAEAAGIDGPQPFVADTIERFLSVVAADWCGYYEFTWARQVAPGVDTYFVQTDQAPDPIDWTSEVVLNAATAWPLRDRLCSSSEPRKLSDFLSSIELQRHPWYHASMRPNGARHEMKMWLAGPDGTVQAFMFVRTRGRQDFDERDRSILALLRPHLSAIRTRWERRHRPSSLTTREAEILDLVAKGMSNAQIANALVVSPLTVRRHLENVFGKLGVHSRSAAVAALRAQ